MSLSAARKQANRKWNEANYAQINFKPTKEYAEELKAYCEKKGISMRQFLNDATREYIERNPA